MCYICRTLHYCRAHFEPYIICALAREVVCALLFISDSKTLSPASLIPSLNAHGLPIRVMTHVPYSQVSVTAHRWSVYSRPDNIVRSSSYLDRFYVDSRNLQCQNVCRGLPLEDSCTQNTASISMVSQRVFHLLHDPPHPL